MLLSDRPATSDRIRELAGLRGAWAVQILVFHATQSSFFFGWSRVDLFFVMSGYFAAHNLLKPGRRRPSLGDDLARRFVRLLSAYYLLILLVTAFDLTCFVQGSAPVVLLAAATLTQNVPLYWSDPPWAYCPRYLAHTWAVAIELQFSVLLLVLHRLVGTAVLAPMALVLLINSVLLRADGLHPWTLLGRGDGFALGMLLALFLGMPGWTGRRSTRFWLYLAVLVGLGYVGWLLVGPPSVPKSFDRPLRLRESLAVLAMDLIYTGLIGLIVCHAGHPVLRPLRVGWLVGLGALSYGFYIFSFASIYIAESLIQGVPGVGHGWATALALALAILAATASRATIERPLRMWVDRWKSAGRVGLPTSIGGGH